MLTKLSEYWLKVDPNGITTHLKITYYNANKYHHIETLSGNWKHS